MNKGRLFTIFLIVQTILVWFGTSTLSAQLYYHNFGTSNITTHPYTAAPVTINENLSNSSWTNSKNSWSSGTGATGQAIQLNTTPGTTSIYLKFSVTNNYAATVTSFNFWRQRSNSGPQNWKLLINGTEIGNGTSPTSGASVGVTSLATPVTVQGNVTIELALTNATGGNFRLDDFTLNGTVVSTCSTVSVSSFSPATGPAGTKVTITGNGFTDASAVKFNGVSSSNYMVISNTEIEAIVPQGALTGKIDVFDSLGCNGTSTGNFSIMTSQCSTPQAPTPDIFISEIYDQKSGSGGMIELYNPTANTIVFGGQYRLLRYGDIEDDTPTPGYDLVLPGTIGPNSTLLLYGTAPAQSTCATPPSTILFGNGFNGNDKFELLKNGNKIDVAHITQGAAGFTTRRKPTAIAPKNVFNAADWDIVAHGTAPDPSYCADLGVFNLPVPPTVTPVATKTICAGANTTFSVTLTNAAGYSYQWKTLNSAGIWVNVTNGSAFSGATTNTLNVIAAAAGLDDTQYYCEMTSLNCNVKSNAAQLYVTILNPPVVSQVPPTCTTATGSITVDLVQGATYSKNGTTFQSSNVFTGLAPGQYTITIKVGTCMASTTITVGNAPSAPAPPQLSQTPPTCTTNTGTITVTAVAGLEYKLDSGAYQASNEFTAVTPGLHTVTVKNAAGCEASSTITVDPAPAAPVTPQLSQTPPTCTTTTGTITVTPVAGLEYKLDSGTYQASNEFTGVAPGLHTITVKNAAGCEASSTITVGNAPSAPAPPQLSQTPPTCTTATGTITVTAVAGLEYKLDSGAYQASNEFTAVTPGLHTVTVKNAAGCEASSTITVDPAPAAPVTPQLSQTPPTCTTTTGTITVTPVAGLEYKLDSGTYQASNEFTGVAPGLHTITVKNAAGCEASSTITVGNAPAAPSTPSATQNPATCNTPATITVTPVAGMEYSIGNGYQASNIFNNVPAGTYNVTVRNAAGCISALFHIIVAPAPSAPSTPTATQNPATCNTSANITVTPVAGMEYSIGNGYQASNIFNNVPAGTYNVTVRNAAGCISAPFLIIVAPAPSAPFAPTATQNPATCNTSATITVTPLAGMEYSIGNGYQASNIFSNVAAGTYNVTVRNAAGCISAPFQIIVAPAPSAPFAPTATQNPATCNTSATITVTPLAGMEYSIGNGYQASNIFSNVAAGTYNVTVRNAAGCISAPFQIIVAPAPNAPSAGIIAGNADVCLGNTLQLTNTATGGTWISSDVAIVTISPSGLVTARSPGTVMITYEIQGPCPASATKTITVHSKPQLALLPEYYLCKDNGTGVVTPKILNSGIIAAGYTFVWRKNNNILPVSTGYISVADVGTYTVTATNTATGCSVTASTLVGISSIASATAEVGFDFDNYQTIRVHVTGGSGDYEYSLDGEEWQGEPYFTGHFEGEYTIHIRDRHGCGTAEVDVLALNYPRFFTPNGDGVNDTWNITGLFMQKTKIYIFDRYGKLITEVRPGVLGWDGTYNGHRLPATDYWFTMRYMSRSGQEKELKAHFAMKR